MSSFGYADLGWVSVAESPLWPCRVRTFRTMRAYCALFFCVLGLQSEIEPKSAARALFAFPEPCSGRWLRPSSLNAHYVVLQMSISDKSHVKVFL